VNEGSNQKRIISIKNPRMRGRTKKLIKPMGKTMNENPKATYTFHNLGSV
jgi:hypothetical protein